MVGMGVETGARPDMAIEALGCGYSPDDVL